MYHTGHKQRWSPVIDPFVHHDCEVCCSLYWACLQTSEEAENPEDKLLREANNKFMFIKYFHFQFYLQMKSFQ